LRFYDFFKLFCRALSENFLKTLFSRIDELGETCHSQDLYLMMSISFDNFDFSFFEAEQNKPSNNTSDHASKVYKLKNFGRIQRRSE
jgi:hypothetical protein